MDDPQHDPNVECKSVITSENRKAEEEEDAIEHQPNPVKQDSTNVINSNTEDPRSSPHIVKVKRKGRRRVRFPEDGKIISERIPPPNPWKNSMCFFIMICRFHFRSTAPHDE